LNPKFAISLYWKCQLIGWSVASLYWGYLGYISHNFKFFPGLLEFISDVATYILITHLYRNFALKHRWQLLNLNQLLKRLIPAVFILGLAYLVATLAKIYCFQVLVKPDFAQSFSLFVQLNWLGMLIAGIRLMSIWLLAYHLYQYAQREINITKENARLALITRDAQLNNLSAQLNPHFLFNSLNNIKALVIENPKSARRAIDLLSDLLRTALYGKDVLLIAIEEELGLVKDFLELEKLRMEERLQFDIETGDNVSKALVPRFSVQTLVENAIKHGIDQQKKGGLVSIKAILENGFVKIMVRNPGKVKIDPEKEGLGLRNLTERINLQFKGKASFTITNDTDSSVLSTLIIPVV